MTGARAPGPEPPTGYGRIKADDREARFVHFSAIEVEGYRTLETGQRHLLRELADVEQTPVATSAASPR